jgi:hypothetical protein
MQFLPERLRDDHPARFVDNKACVHSGTILWANPAVNTIVAAARLKSFGFIESDGIGLCSVLYGC